MSSVEYAGIWSTAGYGRYHSVMLFPGAYPVARDAEAATGDGEAPSVWSLDRYGTVKGWRLQPKDDEHKFIRETVLVQRPIHFNKKHDVMLDAIAHKIAFVTYSQGGLRVSRDMGSQEAEPHSTPLKRSSRCVSAALTPDAKYVVGGGRDGSVCLWCCETGDLLQRFSSESSTHDENNATKSRESLPVPTARPNAHDDWVTCIVVAAANDEQRAATPGIEYTVVTVAFDASLKVWGVGVPPLRVHQPTACAAASCSSTTTSARPAIPASLPKATKHASPKCATFPATSRADTAAAPAGKLAPDVVGDAEGHVTLLHQGSALHGRVDGVVLSPDCSMLIAGITCTERPRSPQVLLCHSVSACGVPEIKVTEWLWNGSIQQSRMVLQLGPMGRSLLVQTVRAGSVRLEVFDAQTLRQLQSPYADPKKTSNAVLCADRTIHVVPSPATSKAIDGYITASTSDFDL